MQLLYLTVVYHLEGGLWVYKCVNYDLNIVNESENIFLTLAAECIVSFTFFAINRRNVWADIRRVDPLDESE